MKRFRYEAKKGVELVKGILSAETKEEAIDSINEMGLVPVELLEERSGGKQRRVFNDIKMASFKSGGQEVAVFYRQLGRLLKSGVPLLPSLALIEEQSDERKLQPVLETIKNQVRQGRSLAEAMGGQPRIFNRFATALVELGESTGHLDEALQRLADCYEKQAATYQKVKNALTYPLFVVLLGCSALVFLLAYVVPKFTKLFSDLGQALPFLTRLLILISETFRKYGLGLLFVIAILAILVHNRLQIRKYRLFWDSLKMKLPLLGEIVFMAQFSVFARSMEILLKGGVPLLRALRTGIPAVSNEAMKEELFEAQHRVEQGASLSESLKSSGAFPKFAVHLLLIGEQTGRLEQSFGDIADWYDQEVEEHARTITQMIEPITILAIGLALGFVAVAILLPVFSMDAIVS